MRDDVLWLITARSGSKSIPNKNIKHLGGVPLLSYPIKAALSTLKDLSGEVWLLTDSKLYANIGEKSGAMVPFIRPVQLASDSASSIDVVLHAMQHASGLGKKFEYIGLLEPTSPFLSENHFYKALEKLKKSSSSSIVAVREHRPNTIFVQDQADTLLEIHKNLKRITDSGRQNFTAQITPSGGLYISKWDDFLKTETFYNEDTLPFMVSDTHGLEIDEPLDWEWAEFLLKKKIIELEKT